MFHIASTHRICQHFRKALGSTNMLVVYWVGTGGLLLLKVWACVRVCVCVVWSMHLPACIHAHTHAHTWALPTVRYCCNSRAMITAHHCLKVKLGFTHHSHIRYQSARKTTNKLKNSQQVVRAVSYVHIRKLAWSHQEVIIILPSQLISQNLMNKLHYLNKHLDRRSHFNKSTSSFKQPPHYN